MQLNAFKIGNVDVKPNLILAPMSGVTSSHFRRLILRENPGAIGLVVTEFISIEGLTRKNFRSLTMMHFRPEERPISIQIFGSDVDRMVDAAKMAEDAGADVVDINSGCPVPRVVRRGGGCELMRQPLHLGKILSSVKAAIRVPLTLKVRAGWDDNSRNAVEIAKIAEASGVSMLAVHGRTRTEGYRGEADWGIIGEVARAVKIPVVGSGDVTSKTKATACLASGVAGLMIGRGAMQNPWIFSDLAAGNEVDQHAIHGAEQILNLLKKYSEILSEDLPEKAAIGRLKQMASQSVRAIPGSADMRRALCCAQGVPAYLALVDEFIEQGQQLTRAREFDGRSEYSDSRSAPSHEHSDFQNG